MTSQYERDLWYEHGLKRAIQVLEGNEIASEYPAMAATEAEQAWRQNGHIVRGPLIHGSRARSSPPERFCSRSNITT